MVWFTETRLLPSTLCFPEHFHEPERFSPFSKQSQFHEDGRKRMRRRTERPTPLPRERRNGSQVSPSWSSLPVPPPLSHHLPSPFLLHLTAAGCTARAWVRDGPTGEQQGTLLQEVPHYIHRAPRMLPLERHTPQLISRTEQSRRECSLPHSLCHHVFICGTESPLNPVLSLCLQLLSSHSSYEGLCVYCSKPSKKDAGHGAI